MKTTISSLSKVRRFTKQERLQSKLSAELKDMLIGLALGDLNIERPTLNGNARLRFAQGLVHEGYLFHLFEKVEPYCSAMPYLPKTLDNRSGKFYPSVRFNTCTFACFNELFELFYPEGKKVIPQSIGDLLTPAGLAYFIMDDGSWTGHGVTLATNSFTKADVELLSKVLENKFNLISTVRKDKNVHLIYISAKSVPLLRSMIKDFMHPTMLYKLGL
jgi:hypothetical protein